MGSQDRHSWRWAGAWATAWARVAVAGRLYVVGMVAGLLVGMGALGDRAYAQWAEDAVDGGASSEMAGGVSIGVEAADVGLGGVYRPGDWTALAVNLSNRTGRPLPVICEWVLGDADGDPLHMRRVATLDPERPGRLWLYAPVPLRGGSRPRWRVNVLAAGDGAAAAGTVRGMAETDASPRAEVGGLLATRLLQPGSEAQVSPRAGLVALTGSSRLGLDAYATAHTQQEPVVLVNDFDPARWPDRWYGLASVKALVWTPDSRDLDDAAVNAGTVGALRHWILRGGHLVVVLPAVGERWTHGPLADLLPAVTLEPIDAQPPPWLGRPDRLANGLPRSLPALALEPLDPDSASVGAGSSSSRAAVLLRDMAGRPLVAGASAGFGRVTLIGLDVTHPALRRLGLPRGPALWQAVFGWQSPAWDRARVDAEVAARRMSSPQGRSGYEQSRFIGVITAMRSTAGGVIAGSIMGLMLYWLAAGPIGFMVLKRRGQVPLAWVVFAVVVAGFSVAAWGAALLLRPARGSVEHVTVLDLDEATGLARMQSWMSLFVPRHRSVALAFGRSSEWASEGASEWKAARDAADAPAGPDTIGSAAFDDRLEAGGFVSPVPYDVAAASPMHDVERGPLRVPMRATTRALSLHAVRRMEALDDDYVTGLPAGRVTVAHGRGGSVGGDVRHGLPEPLRNVLMVYCPGDGALPRVAQQAVWVPGAALALEGLNRPDRSMDLLMPPLPLSADQVKDGEGMNPWRGYLGRLMRSPGAGTTMEMGRAGPQAGDATLFALTEDQTVRMIQRLSFFAMLPPPLWDRVQLFGGDETWHAERTLGRGLDLTDHLAQRRLIVIGHLPDAAAPWSLLVDGRAVPSHGWTVVRWMVPVGEAGAAQ